MESVDLDMNDVFGEEMEEGEDIGALGALPDLQDATQNEENEDADNAEVDKRLKALSKGAAKKVVRRPQPKLDADRLTGARGIPILPKVGEKLKFKGKNHEASDLKILMREMEHWAHRLFPKMPFDEVIERVERLGSKSAVKTCIKKIRLDMPLLDEDFVGSGDEGDDDVERNEDEAGNNSKSAETMWDELIEEDEAMRAMEIDDHRHMDTHMERHLNWGETGDTSVNNEPTASTSGVQSAPETPGPSKATSQTAGQSGTFTPEQLERMERNKQLALERKMKKRGIMTPGAKSCQPSSSQSPMFVATPLRDMETLSSQDATITSTQSSDSQNSQENQQSSDDPLSEVVQAGPSQNIVIDQRQNAQHWCTQTENTDSDKQNRQESCSHAMETDILENTDNTKITNKGTPEVTNDTNTVTEKGAAECMKEVPDSEAMSEVIPIQGSDSKSHDMQHKALGITKHTDGDYISDDTIQDSENMSEVIPVQNGLDGSSESKHKSTEITKTSSGEDGKADNTLTTSKLEDSEKKPEDIPEQNHNGGLDSSENTAQLTESDNDLSQVLPMQNSENIVLKPVTENAAVRSSNEETKIKDKSGVNASNEVKITANIDDKENSDKVAGINGMDQDHNEFDDELSEEQLIESLDH